MRKENIFWVLGYRLENEMLGRIAFLSSGKQYPTSPGWQGTCRSKVEELQMSEKINKQE
jgi:hypothetical protein